MIKPRDLHYGKYEIRFFPGLVGFLEGDLPELPDADSHHHDGEEKERPNPWPRKDPLLEGAYCVDCIAYGVPVCKR